MARGDKVGCPCRQALRRMSRHCVLAAGAGRGPACGRMAPAGIAPDVAAARARTLLRLERPLMGLFRELLRVPLQPLPRALNRPPSAPRIAALPPSPPHRGPLSGAVSGCAGLQSAAGTHHAAPPRPPQSRTARPSAAGTAIVREQVSDPIRKIEA